MKKTKYIWLDGKFLLWNKAKVHFLTHSLHYGSGVFEGIRFYKTKQGPAIFRLKDHLDRLLNSAKIFSIKIQYTKDYLEKVIKQLIKKNRLESGYIRPLAFLG